jgi:hypothetical protein
MEKRVMEKSESTASLSVPSAAVLELHHSLVLFQDFSEFQPELPGLLNKGRLLGECIEVVRTLGILEPFTSEHIPPEEIQISGTNYRESLEARGTLSRSRAVLSVLEQVYGSLDELSRLDIYLAEELTGFARWLRSHVGSERLTQSEYLEGLEVVTGDIPHQDLCALTFSDRSFDLVLCNELFEHLYDLEAAFGEMARVLRPSGRLVATFPMAFGQQESIIKATRHRETGEVTFLGEVELHGDPLRPETGSPVFQIPGWDVLDLARRSGFSHAVIHMVTSWKCGVLGSDLPGVLVLEASL